MKPARRNPGFLSQPRARSSYQLPASYKAAQHKPVEATSIKSQSHSLRRDSSSSANSRGVTRPLRSGGDHRPKKAKAPAPTVPCENALALQYQRQFAAAPTLGDTLQQQSQKMQLLQQQVAYQRQVCAQLLQQQQPAPLDLGSLQAAIATAVRDDELEKRQQQQVSQWATSWMARNAAHYVRAMREQGFEEKVRAMGLWPDENTPMDDETSLPDAAQAFSLMQHLRGGATTPVQLAIAAMATNVEEMQLYDPLESCPSPHPLSPVDSEIDERLLALQERETRHAEERAALQREVRALATEMLDSQGQSCYGDLLAQRHQLQERQKSFETRATTTVHPQQPAWLATVPIEVVDAWRRRCREITDNTVLQRLMRHLETRQLTCRLVQGQACIYTVATDHFYALVGLEPATQQLLFYSKVARDALAPAKRSWHL